MRLLVVGHWSHTGFGTVTRELATRLLAAGHDVRVLADNHRGEPIRGPLAGRVWPTRIGDSLGGNVVTNAISGALWPRIEPGDDWKPETVLVIADMSGLFGYLGQVTDTSLLAWTSVPVYHYCPIEGDNLPPSWKDVWDVVRPVAMADYGKRVIEGLVGRSIPRIYHGVDTDTFRPVSFQNPLHLAGRTLLTRDACKDVFGMSGRKVVLRADRNVTRKFYDKLFEAFVPIARADPDVTFLLHCKPMDPDGPNLGNELMRLPEDLRTRIVLTGLHDTWVGLDTEGLCALYNAADVYVSTTGGEGFGLTLAESLACETPVVSTGWAAEVEVVGPGGVLVPPLEDKYGEAVRFHSGYGMDWAVPDPKGFVEPVLDLLARNSRRRALGTEGRRHVIRNFSWDAAASEFLSLFEESDALAA